MFDPNIIGKDDLKMTGGWLLLTITLICVVLIFGFGYMIGSAVG